MHHSDILHGPKSAVQCPQAKETRTLFHVIISRACLNYRIICLFHQKCFFNIEFSKLSVRKVTLQIGNEKRTELSRWPCQGDGHEKDQWPLRSLADQQSGVWQAGFLSEQSNWDGQAWWRWKIMWIKEAQETWLSLQRSLGLQTGCWTLFIVIQLEEALMLLIEFWFWRVYCMHQSHYSYNIWTL